MYGIKVGSPKTEESGMEGGGLSFMGKAASVNNQ
jgi:hypothetical protein